MPIPSLIDLVEQERQRNRGFLDGATRIIREANDRSNQKDKARNRANRGVRVPQYNATAELQDALWNAGAFKGMKNRQGKELTYAQAVDGVNGNMTKQAIKKAKSMGYTVDENRGKINKKRITVQGKKKPEQSSFNPISGITNLITGWFTPNNYQDSQNRNLQAVLDHSKKLNNNYEYTYVDRDNNKINWITNGKITDSADLVSGANGRHDGYTPLSIDDKGRPLWNRRLNLSSTPAGVFVLSSPHSGDMYEKGSLVYNLIEAKGEKKSGDITNTAFHHAPSSRKAQMKQGQRKLSFGCMYGACDESQQKIDKHLQQADTIYIQPVEEGNYLYEKEGKIRPFYVSTSPHARGTLWGQEYDLNNVRYNTGY